MALDKEAREIKLREMAQKLGCSLQYTYTSNGKHIKQKIVRRIRERF